MLWKILWHNFELKKWLLIDSILNWKKLPWTTRKSVLCIKEFSFLMWNLFFSVDYSLCKKFSFCIRATNTGDSCKRTKEVLVKKSDQGINRSRGTGRQDFQQGRRLQIRGKGNWKDSVWMGRWNFTKAEIAHWGSKIRDNFFIYHLMEKNPAGFWDQSRSADEKKKERRKKEELNELNAVLLDERA